MDTPENLQVTDMYKLIMSALNFHNDTYSDTYCVYDRENDEYSFLLSCDRWEKDYIIIFKIEQNSLGNYGIDFNDYEEKEAFAEDNAEFFLVELQSKQ